MDKENIKVDEPVLLHFVEPLPQNFTIHIADNVKLVGHRTKPFNWLQRRFILWLTGWKAENE